MKGVAWLVLAVIELVACKAGPSTGGSSIDAGDGGDASAQPDAGDPPADPPPQVAPCEVLGLPGPPSINATADHIRLRDIDGDDKLDLVVVRAFTVSVFPGNGDATFRSSIDSSLGGSLITGEPQIADLDGDGKFDLVLPTRAGTSEGLTVALGDGTGQFHPGISYATGTGAAMAVADLNGDGRPDLVLALSGLSVSTIQVRLGNGDGTFGDETPYPVGLAPVGVAAVDIDGDGISDLIVANHVSKTVSILPGKGDGTFRAKLDRDLPSAPNDVMTTDLNGDGKVDVVIRSGVGRVSVLMNDGSGMLRDHVDYAPDQPSTFFGSVVGDINHDGKLDVVVATATTQFLVFAGNGDGTLQPAVAIPSANPALDFALGDVSGDGALDVVTADAGTGVFGHISVLESDGRGGLLSATTYAMGSVDTAVATGDLNRDGYLDLVLTSSSSINIALGKSEGGFSDLVGYPVAGLVGTAVITDVNGDGLADLVVQSTAGSSPRVSVLLGKGDGAFGDRIDSPIVASGAFFFAIGDLDGDGKPDIVVATGNVAAMYAGNGDGTFHPGGNLAVLDSPVIELQIGDLDRDGRLDLVVLQALRPCAECYYHRALDVLLNNGDGTLRALPAYLLEPPSVTVRVADLDGDAKLDVVLSGASVWRGQGDGTLSFAGDFTDLAAGPPIDVQIIDVTGDGMLDIVKVVRNNATSGPPFYSVSILPGNGDASFRSPLSYPYSVTGPVGFADVNRDGRLDVIAPGDTFNVLFARCVR